MHRQTSLPSIVSPVLGHIARLCASGALSSERASAQIERLRAQELTPRGLVLETEEVSGQHGFFVIRDRHGDTLERLSY